MTTPLAAHTVPTPDAAAERTHTVASPLTRTRASGAATPRVRVELTRLRLHGGQDEGGQDSENVLHVPLLWLNPGAEAPGPRTNAFDQPPHSSRKRRQLPCPRSPRASRISQERCSRRQ